MYRINELIQKFLSKKSNKNVKKSTFWYYEYYLSKLEDFERPEDLIIQMNKILKTNTENQNSKSLKYRVFKNFLNYLRDYNRIYFENIDDLSKYTPIPTRRGFTDKEINFLLKELESYSNQKLNFYFKFLLLTGLRVGELKNTNLNELIENNFTMQVQAEKNNNPHTILFLDDYENLSYKKYINNIKEEIIKYKDDFNWTAKSLQNQINIFKNYVLKKYPKFKCNISAHILRHTYITQLMILGLTPSQIQQYTGHKNINTVIHYSHTNLDQMRNQYENIFTNNQKRAYFDEFSDAVVNKIQKANIEVENKNNSNNYLFISNCHNQLNILRRAVKSLKKES
ncbi:site-specific tyrosine recombinase XerS [Mycoplasmopsis maculosa]|uniref:Site-specific tyrosine recombinase XerS n=1 Tax=Mycoplasmopsis maculosa TaxID=114885 RepID=A0A449B4R0_9BACT|nr:site-specific integrase [Mycoplasmopsis maculosa]VEU75594.1 site-specific tyrosine recombinase XerS [Mycoplasmopsis maculosa]